MKHLTIPVTRHDIIPLLAMIKQKGSFSNEFYPVIDQLVATVGSMKREAIISDNDMHEIRYFFGQDFLENTLQGMALLKKYGYAGDFIMIDKIYTGNSSGNQFFRSWDQYFNNQAAPKAVRNRKQYFKQLVLQKLQANQSVKLLNVASGPARDLLELYGEKPADKKLETVCIEMDSHAVAYAEKLTLAHAADIRFINKNIFKFDTEEKFDLVWSAGLFDYFDNKTFVYVLKKFKNWVTRQGEIVIGNFNESHNPSREYMELFGNWYLHHRSANELRTLAIEAGFDDSQLTVGAEAENVNLFLHIRMG
jgi:extracellular factor (EF) 3-hydroxypalmitic acid methyl ester biosynthesis protein